MSHDPLFRPDVPIESDSPRPADGTRPRIGIWGRFESSGFADSAQPAILEGEIRRRLPEAELRVYAPFEDGRVVANDPGFAAADLGAWSARRARELAESLDCVVVTGDLFGVSGDRAPSGSAGEPRLSPFLVEGLGRELEGACPVAWNAVCVAFELESEEAERLRTALAGRSLVSVRDESSRLRLRRAGVETEIALVPDPLLLLPRAFSREVLARRLEFLKHMEWFPRSDEPLVIQQSAAFTERADEIAATVTAAIERSPVPVVVVSLDAGDRDESLGDALLRHLPVPPFRVPAGVGVSDVAAVLAHGRAFLGTSARASIACSAFGVPALVLDGALGGTSRELALAIRRLLRTPRGLGADPADTAALDAHFDRLAGFAEAALVRRVRGAAVSEEGLLARLRENERVLESWRTAYAARTQQVVDLRLRSATLAEAERKLSAEMQTLQDEAARRHHAWAAATAELATERTRAETASRELAAVLAERDELRARQGEVEKALEESRIQASRAVAEAASLQVDVDRTRERLEKARSDYSELRSSHAALFTEIAENRADARRSSELVEELQVELDRLRRLPSSPPEPEKP